MRRRRPWAWRSRRSWNAQINNSILTYRAALAADRLQDAEKQGDALRTQVMKRDFSVSGTEDLKTQLQELQAQRKTLQSRAAGSVRRITAPVAGLYSAVVDGYETVLTPESLEALTPSSLENLKADGTVSSNVGKLVLGDTWYYAAAMPAAQAQELEDQQADGVSLSLRFTKGVDQDLPVTLHSVGAEENGRVVAVFQGDTYLTQLTLLRQQSAQVITNRVEGIRVPREAPAGCCKDGGERGRHHQRDQNHRRLLCDGPGGRLQAGERPLQQREFCAGQGGDLLEPGAFTPAARG